VTVSDDDGNSDTESDTSTVTTPDIAPDDGDGDDGDIAPPAIDTPSVTLFDHLTWKLPPTLVDIVASPIGTLRTLLEVLNVSIDALVIPVIVSAIALFGSSRLGRRRALHLGLPPPQPPTRV
jgi:hypothetical protein